MSEYVPATFGPEEFGVVYPMFKGGEPNRTHFYSTMPERNTLENAEAERQNWISRGEIAYVVSRQWRVV